MTLALTERLSILLETLGVGAVSRDFGRVGDEAANTDGLLGRLGEQAGVTGESLKAGLAAGAAAAAGGLVAFGISSVNAFNESTLAVTNFQRASGATAEQSSLLVSAMDDVGISAETGSGAIFQLAKRLETTGVKLAEFGVEAVRAQDGNIDMSATLLSVADAYTATTDPGKRAALVTAAFGKSGQDLIPILEQGKAGIESFYAGARASGQVFSQDDLDKGKEFRAAMDGATDALKKFQLQAGQKLIPAATEGINDFTTALGWLGTGAEKAGDGIEWLEQQSERWLKTLGIGVSDVESNFRLMNDAADGGVQSLALFGETAAAEMKKAGEAAEVDAAAMDTLMKATLASTAAQRSYDQSVKGVTDAQRGAAEAQDDLNMLLAKGAVDAAAVTAAQRTLAAATEDVERADRSLADAKKALAKEEKALADLRTGATALEEGAEAADQVTAAGFRQRRAVLRLHSAEEDLTGVLADADATADDLTAARLSVEEATFEVTQAENDYTEAQRLATEAAQIGAENSPETIAARDAVKAATLLAKEAEEGLAGAHDDVNTAAAALRKAEAGDPAFIDLVTDARNRLRTAEDLVATAKFGVAQKAYDLATAQQAENSAFETSPANIKATREELEKLVAIQPKAEGFLSNTLGKLSARGTQATVEEERGFMPGLGAFLQAGTGDQINVNVAGSVVSERQLIEAVHEGLLAKQRKTGSLGFGGPTV